MPSPFTPQIRCFFIVALSTLFITLIFLFFLLLRGHAKIIINTQQQQKMNDNIYQQSAKNENNHNNDKIDEHHSDNHHHPIDWNSYHYTDSPSSGHREVRHEEIFVNDYDERHPQQARLKKKQREELSMMNIGTNRKRIKNRRKNPDDDAIREFDIQDITLVLRNSNFLPGAFSSSSTSSESPFIKKKVHVINNYFTSEQTAQWKKRFLDSYLNDEWNYVTNNDGEKMIAGKNSSQKGIKERFYFAKRAYDWHDNVNDKREAREFSFSKWELAPKKNGRNRKEQQEQQDSHQIGHALRMEIWKYLATSSIERNIVLKNILTMNSAAGGHHKNNNNFKNNSFKHLRLDKIELTLFKEGDYYHSHVDPIKYPVVAIGHFPMIVNFAQQQQQNDHQQHHNHRPVKQTDVVGGELQFLCADTDSFCVSIPSTATTSNRQEKEQDQEEIMSQLIVYSVSPHLAPHRVSRVELRKGFSAKLDKGMMVDDADGEVEYLRFGFVAYFSGS